jgi:putative transposase
MERYRITPDSAVYFVTFSVIDWLPVFVSESTCRIITESLQFCCREKTLCVNACVIMPTHLHAIVVDRTFNSAQLQKTLTDFRKLLVAL